MDHVYCADCIVRAGQIGKGWEAIDRIAVTYVEGTAVCLQHATRRIEAQAPATEPTSWSYWVTFTRGQSEAVEGHLVQLPEPIRGEGDLDQARKQISDHTPWAVMVIDFELKTTTR